MLRRSKWIHVASTDVRVGDLAHQALWARLNAVWHYLTLAVHESSDDPEYVHNLRVGTRRAKAALHAFRDWLPARRAPRLKRQLRRIRRAAAGARDYDVLLERLAPWAAARNHPARAALLARVRAQRRELQPELEQIHRRCQRREFERQVDQLLTRLRWRGPGRKSEEPDLPSVAHRQLQAAVDEFFTAARGDLSDVKRLHALRLLGKHLRYAMELFTSAFDASFRDELYPLVEQAQEYLGAINDHATALSHFERWIDDWDDPLLAAPLAEWVAVERAALRKSRRRFDSWWTQERVRDLRQRFRKALNP
ncbi:MAG TPA: CHAD domain-containing protein [Pirellulales bacterium]|nr:CHAD domain-containing protein [Pirellulales bacterium]